jgi:tRNA (adenine22-N1)-methyltransferase
MDIVLSPRLFACSQLVHPGDRVADVGCDHGYLGIYLLKKNIASRVIASDINAGPLSSAVRNSEKYGVEDRISFHLSAGVVNVPRDFDVMICAGMGADTIVSILEDAPWLNSDQYRMILQCQSKTPLLRRYLWEHGWDIRQELAIKDGRFVYTVMEVVRGHFIPANAGQFYFSPALTADSSADAKEYLTRTIKMLRLSVAGKGEKADKTEIDALQELEEII